MDLAGYVINAVLVEGQRVEEVCAAHDLSRSWLYELIARYRRLGEEGLKAQSKRPRSSPTRMPAALEEEIVALRKWLAEGGLDAGAHTIQFHLLGRRGGARAGVPSVATNLRGPALPRFLPPPPPQPPPHPWRRVPGRPPPQGWGGP